ncbi:hypothetical protein [Mesorhizobium sp. CAU 1741]|uniref:hypothetical protein n=1 Tax=Mesorhizobium sp. CAU 1741 TaxID=3140366 RepID=UPI00325C0659
MAYAHMTRSGRAASTDHGSGRRSRRAGALTYIIFLLAVGFMAAVVFGALA